MKDTFHVMIDDVHIAITFTHLKNYSSKLRHPRLKKQRRGTLCDVRMSNLNVVYQGCAYMNPHDTGFDERVGQRVALKNVLSYPEFRSKEVRREIWRAYLILFEGIAQ